MQNNPILVTQLLKPTHEQTREVKHVQVATTMYKSLRFIWLFHL